MTTTTGTRHAGHAIEHRDELGTPGVGRLCPELGIQSSSTSETLRRATAELIANTLPEKRPV